MSDCDKFCLVTIRNTPNNNERRGDVEKSLRDDAGGQKQPAYGARKPVRILTDHEIIVGVGIMDDMVEKSEFGFLLAQSCRSLPKVKRDL